MLCSTQPLISNLEAVGGAEMEAVAMMSTGFCSDFESCRRDVANFLLQWVRRRISSVEVRRLTSDGLLHAVRKWEAAVTGDLESLAEEIAKFAAGSELETGAIVLVRKAPGD
jgi:hypothetical protein